MSSTKRDVQEKHLVKIEASINELNRISPIIQKAETTKKKVPIKDQYRNCSFGLKKNSLFSL